MSSTLIKVMLFILWHSISLYGGDTKSHVLSISGDGGIEKSHPCKLG